MGLYIQNFYKEADMNRNIVNTFSRRKPKHNVSADSHLWTILKKLFEGENSSLVDMALTKENYIKINFAPDGERARKVVRRSNYRMTGKLPSTKCKRMVQWESHYEKSVFQLLELSPYVMLYREQPALIEYVDTDGLNKTHFPDIYAELKNGIRLFIEVKPSSAENDQDLLHRESLLKDSLSKKGFTYIQIYPDQIESFHYLKNAVHMLWHIKSEPPYQVQEKIKQYISLQKNVSLEELITFLNDPNAKSWIFSLFVEGVISFDLSEPLIASTIISIMGNQ